MQEGPCSLQMAWYFGIECVDWKSSRENIMYDFLIGYYPHMLTVLCSWPHRCSYLFPLIQSVSHDGVMGLWICGISTRIAIGSSVQRRGFEDCEDGNREVGWESNEE